MAVPEVVTALQYKGMRKMHKAGAGFAGAALALFFWPGDIRAQSWQEMTFGSCYAGGGAIPAAAACTNNISLAECGKVVEADGFVEPVGLSRASVFIAGRQCSPDARYISESAQLVAATRAPGETAYRLCTDKIRENIEAGQADCEEGLKIIGGPYVLAYNAWTAKQAQEQLGISVPPSDQSQDLYRAKCGAVVQCQGAPLPIPLPPRQPVDAGKGIEEGHDDEAMVEVSREVFDELERLLQDKNFWEEARRRSLENRPSSIKLREKGKWWQRIFGEEEKGRRFLDLYPTGIEGAYEINVSPNDLVCPVDYDVQYGPFCNGRQVADCSPPPGDRQTTNQRTSTSTSPEELQLYTCCQYGACWTIGVDGAYGSEEEALRRLNDPSYGMQWSCSPADPDFQATQPSEYAPSGHICYPLYSSTDCARLNPGY